MDIRFIFDGSRYYTTSEKVIAALEVSLQKRLVNGLEETHYGIQALSNSIYRMTKALYIMIASDLFRRRQVIFSERVADYFLPHNTRIP
jgi:hypothetical protein